MCARLLSKVYTKDAIVDEHVFIDVIFAKISIDTGGGRIFKSENEISEIAPVVPQQLAMIVVTIVLAYVCMT